MSSLLPTSSRAAMAAPVRLDRRVSGRLIWTREWPGGWRVRQRGLGYSFHRRSTVKIPLFLSLHCFWTRRRPDGESRSRLLRGATGSILALDSFFNRAWMLPLRCWYPYKKKKIKKKKKKKKTEPFFLVISSNYRYLRFYWNLEPLQAFASM